MQIFKILNIAFIALIVTLILQMFLPKPAATIADLSTIQKQYTIPNIPVVNFYNSSTGAVEIDMCKDISLNINSSEPSGISERFEEKGKCGTITVQANEKIGLDLSPLYTTFAKVPGNYILTLQVGESAKIISFEMEQPGIFRTFLSTLIYQPIYNLFVAILMALPGHELGWTIILITILIRLILLIPQNRMLENNKKMANITPKIRALQKEYENDRATLGVKMMELYKKEGISPMGSCLPLFIQLPILLALYWVIQGISDPSNFYHLYSFLLAFDPASIQTEFFGIDLLHIGGILGIIMGLILAMTQWIQAYLSFKNQPKMEKTKSSDANAPVFDPQMMQKMMLWVFPIMIGVTGFFFPLGLGLYWWVGLLFMIAQQYYVNAKDVKIKKKWEIIKK